MKSSRSHTDTDTDRARSHRRGKGKLPFLFHLLFFPSLLPQPSLLLLLLSELGESERASLLSSEPSHSSFSPSGTSFCARKDKHRHSLCRNFSRFLKQRVSAYQVRTMERGQKRSAGSCKPQSHMSAAPLARAPHRPLTLHRTAPQRQRSSLPPEIPSWNSPRQEHQWDQVTLLVLPAPSKPELAGVPVGNVQAAEAAVTPRPPGHPQTPQSPPDPTVTSGPHGHTQTSPPSPDPAVTPGPHGHPRTPSSPPDPAVTPRPCCHLRTLPSTPDPAITSRPRCHLQTLESLPDPAVTSRPRCHLQNHRHLQTPCHLQNSSLPPEPARVPPCPHLNPDCPLVLSRIINLHQKSVLISDNKPYSADELFGCGH